MPSESHSNLQLLALIGRLYDAALDDDMWKGITAHIAAAFGSTSTVLKLHDASNRVQLLDTTDNFLIAERDREWADHWHRHDLWVERSVVFGMSQVVTSQDLVSSSETEKSGFYNEWLHHLGIHHMIGAVFATEGDGVGVLGIHRPRAGGAYSNADRQKADLVVPHIQRAFRVRQRLRGTSLLRDAALDALNRLDTGVVLLDPSRQILYLNGLAETVLHNVPEVAMSNGRLKLRNPTLDNELETLVRRVVALASLESMASPATLAIPRREGQPLSVVLAPFRPHWSPLDRYPALVLLFIRDPARILPDPALLRALFGLTRTEARTAVDLLCGMSLADIAAERGVGRETVRSHIKKILTKTGTRRQAEAIALLSRALGSVVSSHPNG